MVEFLEVQHTQRRERPMAMDDIWDPTELLDRLKSTTNEEYRSLVVIVGLRLGVCIEETLTLEEIVVVDKVHLKPCRGDGCHFDYKGTVHIIYYEIDPRETNDFMQLIASLIDQTEAGHEDTDIIS